MDSDFYVEPYKQITTNSPQSVKGHVHLNPLCGHEADHRDIIVPDCFKIIYNAIFHAKSPIRSLNSIQLTVALRQLSIDHASELALLSSGSLVLSVISAEVWHKVEIGRAHV